MGSWRRISSYQKMKEDEWYNYTFAFFKVHSLRHEACLLEGSLRLAPLQFLDFAGWSRYYFRQFSRNASFIFRRTDIAVVTEFRFAHAPHLKYWACFRMITTRRARRRLAIVDDWYQKILLTTAAEAPSANEECEAPRDIVISFMSMNCCNFSTGPEVKRQPPKCRHFTLLRYRAHNMPSWIIEQRRDDTVDFRKEKCPGPPQKVSSSDTAKVNRYLSDDGLHAAYTYRRQNTQKKIFYIDYRRWDTWTKGQQLWLPTETVRLWRFWWYFMIFSHFRGVSHLSFFMHCSFLRAKILFQSYILYITDDAFSKFPL